MASLPSTRLDGKLAAPRLESSGTAELLLAAGAHDNPKDQRQRQRDRDLAAWATPPAEDEQ